MGILASNPTERLGNGSTVEQASPGRRLAARMLDLLLLSPAMVLFAGSFVGHYISSYAYGVSAGLGAGRDPGFEVSPLMPLYAWAALLVLVLYEPLMVARWGATVGKMAVGVRVVRFADGARVSRGQSWGRVAVPSAAGVLTLGVGWFVAWLALAWPLLAGNDWRGWHDRLVGTAVVAKASATSLRPAPWGRGGGRRVRRGDCAPDAMGERWLRFMRGDGAGS